MTHPLSLSDAQLNIVLEAAKSIEPSWRSRFLENVADRLLPLPTISNEDVAFAVWACRMRMRLGAPAA